VDEITTDDRHSSIRKTYRKLGEVACDGESRYGKVLTAVLDSYRAETLRVASPLFSLIKRPDFELWLVDQIFGY
jgi:hypothetical protein